MRSTLLILLALAVGCDKSPPPTQTDHDLNEAIVAVSVGIATAGNAPAPTPNPEPQPGECDNCGGTGWLGDGTIWIACSECNADEHKPKPSHDPPAKETTPPELSCEVEVNSASPAAGQAEADEFWRTDLDAAIEESTSEPDKVILLVFASDWCGPCRELKKAAFTDATIRKWWGNYCIPVLVDARENPTLRKRFNVKTIPRLFVFREGTRKYESTDSDTKNRKAVTQWFQAKYRDVLREERQ